MYALPPTLSTAPAQHERIEPPGDLHQSGAASRVHGRQWMAWRLAVDHPAFLHQRLGGEQPALTVLPVDQRQPALVKIAGLLTPVRGVGVDDQADTVRIAAAR